MLRPASGSDSEAGAGGVGTRRGGGLPAGGRPAVVAVALEAVVLALAACSGEMTAPPVEVAARDTVVLGFRERDARLEVVDGERGRVVARHEVAGEGGFRVVRGVFETMVDRPAGLVLAAVQLSAEASHLVAFSVPGLEERRREPFDAIEARFQGEEGLQIGGRMRLGPRGERLAMEAFLEEPGDPEEFADEGVVVVERAGLRPMAFLGGFPGGDPHFAWVRGTGGAPDLLAVGGGLGKEESPFARDSARTVIYDGETWAARDSVPRGPFRPGSHAMAPGRDGRHVFALTDDSLFKIDARAGEIVARRRRAGTAVSSDMVVTPDRELVLVTDGGPGVGPGSGLLQVYGAADLGYVGVVDLASSEVPGAFSRPAMRAGITFNTEGDRAYVGSGTGHTGLGGFMQETSVSVVDLERLRLVRTLVIGGFGLHTVDAF